MSVKWIAVFFSCFLLGSLWSADRLAVAEPSAKGVSPQEAETFWSLLESSVGGDYEVVSRAALKQVLAEIGFAEHSGLAGADAKQSAKSSEIKTVKYVLVSSLGRLGSRLNLSLSLVDASTGEVIPGRKAADTVESLDELPARLPGLLREIGLGDAAKMHGIYAMLAPVVTVRNPPQYLADSFTTGLEAYLLRKQVRLRSLKTIEPLLRRNGIGPLDAADPALFAKVGALLRVDALIMPRINRFSVTETKEYVAASKRTVVRHVCDLDGEIRVLVASTGEMTGVIPFQLKLDLDTVDAKVNTDDWTSEDYGKYGIELLVSAVGAELVRALGK